MTIFTREDSIDLPELAAAPAAPEAGRRKVYMAEDGTLYAINSSGNVIPPISPDARIVSLTSDYTLTPDDSGKIFECNGAITITCPGGAVDRHITVMIVNIGTEVITIVPFTNITLQSKGGASSITEQFGIATIYQRAYNIYLLAGDIS